MYVRLCVRSRVPTCTNHTDYERSSLQAEWYTQSEEQELAQHVHIQRVVLYRTLLYDA